MRHVRTVLILPLLLGGMVRTAEAQCAGGSCGRSGRSMGLSAGTYGGGGMMMARMQVPQMVMAAPPQVVMAPPRVIIQQVPVPVQAVAPAAQLSQQVTRSGGLRGVLFGRRTRTQVMAPAVPMVIAARPALVVSVPVVVREAPRPARAVQAAPAARPAPPAVTPPVPSGLVPAVRLPALAATGVDPLQGLR